VSATAMKGKGGGLWWTVAFTITRWALRFVTFILGTHHDERGRDAMTDVLPTCPGRIRTTVPGLYSAA
jgi:hypothetical protein